MGRDTARRIPAGDILNFLLATFLMGGLLIASTVSAQTITRDPYLQTATPDSIIVAWRTSVATDATVYYGTDPANLAASVTDPTITTDHFVQIGGLTENTRYYYAVGTSTQVLAGDASYTFETYPTVGVDHPTRIWVEGDSGKYDWTQFFVRDAYVLNADPKPADLWLMLGDNAYVWGYDWEYQDLLFDIYPKELRSLSLWPSIGNHEIRDGVMQAYLDIFDLPTAGEAGGVPSGTEEYHSFDYGDIHFVNLNTMQDDLTAGGPMMTWLEADLATNDKHWLIAFWHHLPYATGGVSGHLSDAMRENALPILEAYGVDVVLTGHYHNYRRSRLLNGHYGYPYSTPPSSFIDIGDGQEDSDGPYIKAGAGGTPNEGAVYVLNGSSGQTSPGYPVGPLSTPSFAEIALNELGSVVIDVAGNRLEYEYIDDEGVVRDYFTMYKGPDIYPPALVVAQSAGTDKIQATFAEPVDATSAQAAANYTVTGLAVTSATLLPDGRSVELEVSPMTLGTDYVLTVSNIQDLAANVTSTLNNTVPFTADTRLPGDMDADGMDDLWEFRWGRQFNINNYTIDYQIHWTDPNDGSLDMDGDGLDNLTEFESGTLPHLVDTDDDGLDDGDEVNNYGSDPTNPDSDGDEMPDGWEVEYGLNPSDAGDATLDLDNDLLTNLDEYQYGANPTVQDSDGDWIKDGFEVYLLGTNPISNDTDNDTMPDFWEAINYVGPNNAASGSGDPDNDGLTNLEEFQRGLRPRDADTDGDGMSDGWEVANGINPTFPSADRDPDADGLVNIDEMLNNTDPLVEDTDGEGLLDGAEVNTYGTSPVLTDTDGDGINDAFEVLVSGTDPLLTDTDGDTMPDYWETLYFVGPTDPNSGSANPDGDAYTNLQEYQNGTLPRSFDP